MESYSVSIKLSAAKDLDQVPSNEARERLVRCIAGLADEPCPPGSQRLSGRNRYRVRQGFYRIVHEITDPARVVVVKVGHRREVKRDV